MASWYSKLLTTTTSQISSLQSRILQSENDGDTEDDTHVCRVLRGYYTEQGKVFPAWLPPDPKAPPPAAPVYAQPQVGSRYGGLGQQQAGGSGGSATGLSSLWGDSSGGGAGRQGGAPPPQATSLRQNHMSRGGNSDRGRNEALSRPLPSQRGGSYQQSHNYGRDSGSTPPPPAGAGGSSAQDKLKQRLWGGGARTTSPSSGSSGPFQPPRQGGTLPAGARGGNQGGDYEGRFAPGGMHDPSAQSKRGGDKPFVAANSPWASNEDEYGGGGRSNRQGLPNGPRGLPSGPRMR